MPFARFRSLFSLVALCLLPCACATSSPPVAPVSLAVVQTARGVMLWIPENAIFPAGGTAFSVPGADAYLDRVAKLLRDKVTGNLLLEGHTDDVGSPAANVLLSLRQAEAVRQALLQRGVRGERMQALGIGMSRPLVPNDGPLGRGLNRRVELILLDETVESLTRGEPAGAYELVLDRLQRQLASAPTT